MGPDKGCQSLPTERQRIGTSWQKYNSTSPMNYSCQKKQNQNQQKTELDSKASLESQ